MACTTRPTAAAVASCASSASGKAGQQQQQERGRARRAIGGEAVPEPRLGSPPSCAAGFDAGSWPGRDGGAWPDPRRAWCAGRCRCCARRRKPKRRPRPPPPGRAEPRGRALTSPGVQGAGDDERLELLERTAAAPATDYTCKLALALDRADEFAQYDVRHDGPGVETIRARWNVGGIRPTVARRSPRTEQALPRRQLAAHRCRGGRRRRATASTARRRRRRQVVVGWGARRPAPRARTPASRADLLRLAARLRGERRVGGQRGRAGRGHRPGAGQRHAHRARRGGQRPGAGHGERRRAGRLPPAAAGTGSPAPDPLRPCSPGARPPRRSRRWPWTPTVSR